MPLEYVDPTVVLFALLGVGTNYMVPVALFLQIPLMQQRQPEGIRLASLMNAAVNVPTAISAAYVLYRARPQHCRRADKAPKLSGGFRQDALIVVLLIANVAAASLASAAWYVVIEGASLCLFIACSIAGTVGSMSAVVLMPWISRYSAALIPAVNTGGTASMLLLALIDMAEGPGEEHPRFGASAFFGIVAGLSVVPVLAYLAIYYRRHQGTPMGALHRNWRAAPFNTEVSLATLQPTDESSTTRSGDTRAGSSQAESVPPTSTAHVLVLEDVGLEDDDSGRAAAAATTAPAVAGARSRPRAAPLRSLLHYAGLNFAVNFVCWGLQPSLLPLAARHATATGASEGPLLQVCTVASNLCVTLGHASTHWLATYRLNLITALYMSLAVIFLLAAVGAGDWRSTAGAVSIGLLVGATRFLDGFFTSTLSMEICAAHDGPRRATFADDAACAKRKEHVLLLVGFAGAAGTLIGMLISLPVVAAMAA